MPRRTPADPVVQQLGATIRRIREERGETLDQVANRIERMDAKYLGESERGWHAPTVPTAKRIADALGITLADLVRDL
jgi:transcriptional regulator with XRE-family HTH domain